MTDRGKQIQTSPGESVMRNKQGCIADTREEIKTTTTTTI